MLNELHIENIAVIERADIQFQAGLNVLTGETGAGKSIIIDSISAVLGERVSRDLVRHGAEKGLVTAVFDLANAEEWLAENDIEAEDELIMQRRISLDGKSSCRVCGNPVTATQLKELGSLLIDIHGQNDGRQLMDERRHMEYLDRFGALEEELSLYQNEYRAYVKIQKEMEQLSMDEIEKARLSDSLQYQIAELERAELKAGEKDGLVARRDLLRNAEKLTEAVDEAFAALYGGEENAVAFAFDTLTPVVMNKYLEKKCYSILIAIGLLWLYLFFTNFHPIKDSWYKKAVECPAEFVDQEKCKYCGGVYIVGFNKTCPHCGAPV